MDVAVISPVDGPAGGVLARSLLRLGFRVHALSSRPEELSLQDRQLQVWPVVPGRLDSYQAAARQILETEKRIDLLLLQPPPPPNRSLEDAPLRAICESALEGMVVPLALTKLFLPGLLDARGHVVFVLPRVRLAKPGVNYFASCTSGLGRLATELFETHRHQGLRCSRIDVEIDESAAPREASVEPGHLGEAVEGVLRHHRGSVATDLYLRVQGDAFGSAADPSPDGFESTILPAPGDFPQEEKPIPTRQALDPMELHREAGTVPGGYDEDEEDEAVAAVEAETKEITKKRPSRRRGRRRASGAGGAPGKDPAESSSDNKAATSPPPVKRAAKKTAAKRPTGSRGRGRRSGGGGPADRPEPSTG